MRTIIVVQIAVGITGLILSGLIPVLGPAGIIGSLAALLSGIGDLIFYRSCNG